MGQMQSAPTDTSLCLEESSTCSSDLHGWFARNGPALRSNHPQFAAVLEQNVQRLESVLKDNPERPVSVREGFSPFHACIFLGWLEGAGLLLKAGADLNCRSSQDYTPLHLAAALANLQAVNWLLERGASVDARTKRGSTALHWAAQSASAASKAVLRRLLAAGAAISVHGYRYRSPLQLAVCAHGDVEVVRALLERGSDPSEANPVTENFTPLHSCCSLARVDAMRVLLEAGANPNARTYDGMTPLLEIFCHSHGRHGEAKMRAMARLLLDAGAQVNAVPPTGFGLLHMAIQSCHESETVDLLLERGLDASYAVDKPLSSREPTSKTRCLHIAAQRGWAGLVERLVRAGADAELKDRDGFSPLHLAVIHRHTEVVRVLLRLGADPAARCPDIYPGYSRWRMQRSLQAMQALLQMEEPPQNMAEMLEVLMANNGPTATAMDIAVSTTQDIPMVEAFLERGLRPSDQALARGAADTPLLRTLVEGSPWTPQLHRRLPRRFQTAARELLLCLNHTAVSSAGEPLHLPPGIVANILHKAAFPVSEWATAHWLACQQRSKPTDHAGPISAQAGAQGAGAAGAGGGAAAGAAGAGAGAPHGPAGPGPGLGGLGALMQHIINAVQDQLAGGAQGGFVPMPDGLLADAVPPFGAPDGPQPHGAWEAQGVGAHEHEAHVQQGGAEGQQQHGEDEEEDDVMDGEDDLPGPGGNMHFVQVQFHVPIGAGPGQLPPEGMLGQIVLPPEFLVGGPLVPAGGMPPGAPPGPHLPPLPEWLFGGPGMPFLLDSDDELEEEEVDDEPLPQPPPQLPQQNQQQQPQQQQHGDAGMRHAATEEQEEEEQCPAHDEAGPSSRILGKRRASSPPPSPRYDLRSHTKKQK